MKKNLPTNNAEAAGDIIDLILEDHKDLKRLIKILKDSEADFGDRYAAFEEFAPLLMIHAKPEEQTLYVDMKKDADLRVEALEGDTEHALADQLCNEAKATTDEDLWSAKVKVLAELVEHHIEEEEEDMLPDYKKRSDKMERMQLGEVFMAIKMSIGMEDPMFMGLGSQPQEQPAIH